MVEKLEHDNTINTILITSITLSSSQVIKEKTINKKKIIHQFLPLDIPNFVKKFLIHWSPDIAIFVESEIWPNLIKEIKKRKIPLLLISARITKKSFERWNYVKSLAREIFGLFNLCLTSNSETETFLKNLGAKQVKNIGNIKFSSPKNKLINKVQNPRLDNLIKNKKIWCAASTHKTEELICAKVHLNIQKIIPDLLTIIIPRNILRVEDIKKEISNLNLRVEKFSNISDKSKIDVLLIDSYGKSEQFYNLSNIVFLGGSLIKHGGQNPLEPSRLQCKVIHGPYVDNFIEIYEYLKTLNISYKVKNVEEMSEYILQNIKANKMDHEIVKEIDDYGHEILEQYIKEIQNYLNLQ